MRVAIVSDIHGNRRDCESILGDLRRTKEDERFLSAQAYPFPTGAAIEDHRSERGRKSRPAPFGPAEPSGMLKTQMTGRWWVEMIPVTVPVLKPSHDPSASVGMTS
jgi:hypothetical protein